MVPRAQPDGVPRLDDSLDHLRVPRRLAAHQEERRLRVVLGEDLEHPQGRLRVRAGVERERHATRTARTADDGVDEDAPPEQENAGEPQRRVRHKHEDAPPERRWTHEDRPERHHEHPGGGEVDDEASGRH